MKKAPSRKYGDNYKWLICAGATMLMFCITGLCISAFSVYLPYIREANQFSATETNLIVTCRTFSQLAGLAVVGRYYQRFKLRVGAALTAVGVGIGFVLYGFAQTHTAYYAIAIGFGFVCGLGSTASSLAISEWFRENKATALGICAAGTGLATVVTPVVVATLVRHYSLRAAFCAEGGFVLLVAVFVFLIFRENPETSAAPGAAGKASSAGAGRSAYALPGSSATLITGGVFLVGLAVFGITGGLPQLFRDYYDEVVSSLLASAFGAALLAGKLICGRLTDKLGILRANYIFYGCVVAGGIGTFFAKQSLPLLVVSIIALGVGSSLSTVSVPFYASEFCVPGRYVDALRRFSIAQTVGGLLISYITGIMADTTGNNSLLFLLVAALTLVSAIMVQTVCRRKEA